MESIKLIPVLIEWLDHTGSRLCEWKELEEVDCELYTIMSCGFVLKENDETITIIQSIVDNGLGAMYMTISNVLIQNIVYLDIDKKKKKGKK